MQPPNKSLQAAPLKRPLSHNSLLCISYTFCKNLTGSYLFQRCNA